MNVIHDVANISTTRTASIARTTAITTMITTTTITTAGQGGICLSNPVSRNNVCRRGEAARVLTHCVP